MPKTKEEAHALYKEGQKYYKAKKVQQALALFHQCEAIYAGLNLKNHQFSYSQGLCLKALGCFPDALEQFEQCLRIQLEKVKNGINIDTKPVLQQIKECKPKAKDMMDNQYAPTFGRSWLYAPQGYGILHEFTEDADVSGMVTDEFSNCSIICLSDPATNKALLLHADARITHEQIVAAIALVGDECKKEVVIRNPFGGVMHAQFAYQILQLQLGDLFDSFGLYVATDQASHVVVSRQGLYVMNQGQYQGQNQYHPEQLGLEIFRKLNAFLDPQPEVPYEPPLVICQDGEWQEIPEDYRAGSAKARAVLGQINPERPSGYSAYYQGLCDYALTSSVILDGLKALVPGEFVGGNDDLLNTHEVEDVLGRMANLLQQTCFLEENNFISMLKLNVEGVIELEMKRFTRQSADGKFLLELVACCNRDGDDFYAHLNTLVDSAEKGINYFMDMNFQLVVRSVKQFMKFYQAIEPIALQAIEAQVGGPSMAPP